MDEHGVKAGQPGGSGEAVMFVWWMSPEKPKNPLMMSGTAMPGQKPKGRKHQEIAERAASTEMEWIMDNFKLKAIVRTLLTERFPEANVSDVIIQPDMDGDGDKILRITVVLASRPELLDRDNLVGFVRHLRPRLATVNENDFPLVSFVSVREAGKLKREAA